MQGTIATDTQTGWGCVNASTPSGAPYFPGHAPVNYGMTETQKKWAQQIRERREWERAEQEKINEQKKADAARRVREAREREFQERRERELKRIAEDKRRAAEQRLKEERKQIEIEKIKNYPRTIDFYANERAWAAFEEMGCKPGLTSAAFGLKLKPTGDVWLDTDPECFSSLEEKEEGEI